MLASLCLVTTACFAFPRFVVRLLAVPCLTLLRLSFLTFALSFFSATPHFALPFLVFPCFILHSNSWSGFARSFIASLRLALPSLALFRLISPHFSMAMHRFNLIGLILLWKAMYCFAADTFQRLLDSVVHSTTAWQTKSLSYGIFPVWLVVRRLLMWHDFLRDITQVALVGPQVFLVVDQKKKTPEAIIGYNLTHTCGAFQDYRIFTHYDASYFQSHHKHMLWSGDPVDRGTLFDNYCKQANDFGALISPTTCLRPIITNDLFVSISSTILCNFRLQDAFLMPQLSQWNRNELTSLQLKIENSNTDSINKWSIVRG